MSLNLKVSWDEAKAEALAKGLVAMPRQLEKARARALRKVSGHVRSQVKKEACKALRIPQRSIADRFFLSRIRPADVAATLWIGTWNLSPFSLGQPSAGFQSVWVPGRRYRGAWLGTVYSGKEQIWIRRRSKWYRPELYPTYRKLNSGGVPPELRHRFPVVRAAVPIDGVLQKVVQRDWPDIEARFRRTLQQEINYEVNVRGKK